MLKYICKHWYCFSQAARLSESFKDRLCLLRCFFASGRLFLDFWRTDLHVRANKRGVAKRLYIMQDNLTHLIKPSRKSWWAELLQNFRHRSSFQPLPTRSTWRTMKTNEDTLGAIGQPNPPTPLKSFCCCQLRRLWAPTRYIFLWILFLVIMRMQSYHFIVLLSLVNGSNYIWLLFFTLIPFLPFASSLFFLRSCYLLLWYTLIAKTKRFFPWNNLCFKLSVGRKNWVETSYWCHRCFATRGSVGGTNNFIQLSHGTIWPFLVVV